MKVTTLADGSQLQYIKLSGQVETRWISHVDSMLATNRPEHAQGFLPAEALAAYRRLVSLGYKGLSITNALPDTGRKMLKYTKLNENERGWFIEFEVPITESNFKEACQSANDIAKIECTTKNTLAINFLAMGIDVQVTEKDTVETQLALWKPRADAYNAIRNELAKSWNPQYLDNKGLPIPSVHCPSCMRP